MKKIFRKASVKVVSFLLIVAVAISLLPFNVFADQVNITLTFNVGDNQNVVYAANGNQLSGIAPNPTDPTKPEVQSWIGFKKADTNEDVTISSVNCNANNTECTVVASVEAGTGIDVQVGGDSGFVFQGNINNIVVNSTLTAVIRNEGGDEPNTQFNGSAYLMWDCDGKVCMKHFANLNDQNNPIINIVDDVVYIKDSDIVDDISHTKTFNINARLKGWADDNNLANWITAYKQANNIAENEEIDWSTVNPEDMIGDPIDMKEWEDAAITAKVCLPENFQDEDEFHQCVDGYVASQNGFIARAQLQPVGEPSERNAYVSYGDRKFKAVVYNNNYKAVTIGTLDGLTYYPAIWTDRMFRQDSYDISGTTANNPAEVTAILLESTVNLKLLGVNANGVTITSVEALDVPDNAVSTSITNNGTSIKAVFSSNFYDKVVFKVKTSDNNTYYIRIVRQTLEASLGHDNHTSYLSAMFYFDRRESYNNFVITAKILYLDGSTKTIELENVGRIDMGGNNIVIANEVDEENPPAEDQYGHPTVWPLGKGLKKAFYKYEVSEEEERTISKIYINVEKTGSTSTNYAGAFAGSGKGIEIEVNRGGNE